MKFIVWMMVVAFAFSGCLCLFQAVKEFVIVLRRRASLRKVQGLIISVETTRETRTGADSPSRMRTYVKFFPVIEFVTELGEKRTFKSETGDYDVVRRGPDGSQHELKTRYHVGRGIDVVYDPQGELPPRIASFAGIYGPGLGILVAGIGFLGAVALIWFAFGNRLMGR